MNYRLSKFFLIPFAVTPYIRIEKDFFLEIEIQLKNELCEFKNAKYVNLRFNTPEKVNSVRSDVSKDSKDEVFEFDEKSRQVLWRITNFKGATEKKITVKIHLLDK